MSRLPAAALILAFAVPIDAADPPLHPGMAAEARRYAPIVWLAADERIYPMMPHPFAFDGLDNDANGLIDLDDPDEVALDVVGGSSSRVASILSGLVERLRYREFSLPNQDEPLQGTISDDLREALQNNGVWIAAVEALMSPAVNGQGSKECYWLWHSSRLERTSKHDWDGATIYSYWELADRPRSNSTHCNQVPPLPNQHICLRWDKDNRSLLVQRPDMLPPARVGYRKAAERVHDHDVHQYWTYYLFDEGSGPHPHDPEHYFAFVDEYGKLRAAVGSAHAEDVGNNVLIVGRAHETTPPKRTLGAPNAPDRDALESYAPVSTRRLPQELPNNMPVSVELGKHALSPDRDFDGRFAVASDANYNYRGSWGVRDVAAAIGSDRLGKVSSEYSFPRDATTMLPERCWLEAFATLKLKKNGPVAVSDGGPTEINMKQAQLAEETLALLAAPGRAGHAGDECRTHEFLRELQRRPTDEALLWRHDLPPSHKFGPDKAAYDLFPLQDMTDLQALIQAKDKQGVEAFLSEHQNCFWGAGHPTAAVVISEAAWAALKDWPGEHGGFDHLINTEDYRHPEAVFKSWLSPSVALRYGYHYRGDGVVRLGVQIADLTLKLPRYGKFRFNPYSTWTPFAEFSDTDFGLQAIGLNVDLFRGGHHGAFFGFAWAGLNGEHHAAVNAGLVALSTSVGFLPGRMRLSLRTGARAELHDGLNLVNGSLDLSAHIDLPLARRKHPLSY